MAINLPRRVRMRQGCRPYPGTDSPRETGSENQPRRKEKMEATGVPQVGPGVRLPPSTGTNPATRP